MNILDCGPYIVCGKHSNVAIAAQMQPWTMCNQMSVTVITENFTGTEGPCPELLNQPLVEWAIGTHKEIIKLKCDSIRIEVFKGSRV